MEIADNREEKVITDGGIAKIIRGGSQTEIILETGYSITIPHFELEKITGPLEPSP